MYLHIEITQKDTISNVDKTAMAVVSFDDAYRQHFVISFDYGNSSNEPGSGDGGGGDVDLPLGVLGDLIYHDGVDWVAKNISTLNILTLESVVSIFKTKLDKHVWDAEFEVLPEYLRAKRSMVYGGQVFVEEFNEAGGGGADLPLGVLGDVLYHDGVDWVAKNISTLGLATQSWVTQQGYIANNDARLSDARPASDVYAWAKAATKPTYTATEVGADMGGRLSITTEKPNYGTYMLFNQIPEGGDASYPYGWQNVIRMLHANTQGYWTEIATSFTGSQDMHYRCMQGGIALPWRKMWHDGNSNQTSIDWTAKDLYAERVKIGGVFEIKKATGLNRLGVTDYNEMTAMGVNVGSLLISNTWMDSWNVPANGLFVKGQSVFNDTAVFKSQVVIQNF